MKRIRRILHATDFSRASARALAEAIGFAKQNHAELLLLHVAAPITPYLAENSYVSPALYTQMEESERREAESAMRTLVEKAKRARIRVKSMLLKGVPHEGIIRVARTRRVDLIVIGTHGRTGISKFFMGSVAGRVVAMAHCPVLTVRGR